MIYCYYYLIEHFEANSNPEVQNIWDNILHCYACNKGHVGIATPVRSSTWSQI